MLVFNKRGIGTTTASMAGDASSVGGRKAIATALSSHGGVEQHVLKSSS